MNSGHPNNGSGRIPRPLLIAHRSSLPALRPWFSPAYTLVELFLTIAVLMIVLGLMVNLANRVRGESADRLTRQMLQRLTILMDSYLAANAGTVPQVTPLLDTAPVDELTLKDVARQNNREFLQCLKLSQLPADQQSKSDPLLSNLRWSAPDQSLLDDPWGSPIVFMPRQNPAVGMAPHDRPFFFSRRPGPAVSNPRR